MQTIPIQLPEKLAALFDEVCLENNTVKQEVLKELVIRYLEDIEDAADAARALESKESTVPLEQVRRELGLEN